MDTSAPCSFGLLLQPVELHVLGSAVEEPLVVLLAVVGEVLGRDAPYHDDVARLQPPSSPR
jgi:hypothetical protein